MNFISGVLIFIGGWALFATDNGAIEWWAGLTLAGGGVLAGVGLERELRQP